tara:strand:- start:219 stop:1409 length:1191 start_codon:yes stop_codon:yes gene_type:complete
MKVFDKFFTKFAYKFDKGYPDMDNPNDVLLLESLLSKFLDEKITLEAVDKKKSIEAAQDFVDNSKFAKDNEIKKFKTGKYANRISSSKEKDLDKIKDALIDYFKITDNDVDYIEPGTGPAAKDSMPGFKLDNTEFGEIFISVSTSRKGVGGKLNEERFMNYINNFTEEGANPITVKLEGPDGEEQIYKDVALAIDVAGGTKDKLKADVALLNPENQKIANISLKMEGGFRWASLNNDKETNFRLKFIDAALNNPDFPITLKQNPDPKFEGKTRYEMFREERPDERITLVVVNDAPYTKDPVNIFGTDNPSTIVVGKTFEESDFKFNESTNTLVIDVDHIYTSMEDIDGSPYEMVFIVAQHSGNPYGLDFRAYPKFMAKLPKKGTGIEINYNDIIKD